uniref:Uncharacterized protein n=1 Tax=Anguilla anguilla TaxID=7936 RepID=A0A0E9R524_ANGAN
MLPGISTVVVKLMFHFSFHLSISTGSFFRPSAVWLYFVGEEILSNTQK